MVFNKVLSLYVVLIGFQCLAMEREKEKDEEKGKEKELKGSLILCAPIPSTPLSQRRTRALSLSLNPQKQLLEPKRTSSRRHSLEVLYKTESQFEVYQKKYSSLFAILDIIPIPQQKPLIKTEEIESWIDISYLNGLTSYIPQTLTHMPQLQEKKFALLKFLVGRLQEIAGNENDAEHMKYAKKVEKRLLKDQNSYYIRLYLKNAQVYKRNAELALGFAETEIDQRKKLILYNTALAFSKESKDFLVNAKKNKQDVSESINETWKLLMTITSKIHTSKDYESFRRQCEIAGSIKNKSQQIMKDVEQLEKKIIEKQKKINTPRTRTAKFTLDPRLMNKDRRKIKKIIKKLQIELGPLSPASQNEKKYFDSALSEFIELKKSKKKNEFYKKILEYKIEKLKLQSITLLNSAEEQLIRSSEKYIKSFNYNPQLPVIIAIKDNIDRIRRAQAKKRNLNYKHKISSKAFAEVQVKLHTIKQEVQKVIQPIYQQQDTL